MTSGIGQDTVLFTVPDMQEDSVFAELMNG